MGPESDNPQVGTAAGRNRSVTVYALVTVAVMAALVAVAVSLLMLGSSRETAPEASETALVQAPAEEAAAQAEPVEPLPVCQRPDAPPAPAPPEEPPPVAEAETSWTTMRSLSGPEEPAPPADGEAAAEETPPPTTRDQWLARLGEARENHPFTWGSGVTTSAWGAGLTEEQARRLLALEDRFAPVFQDVADAHHAIQEPLLRKAGEYSTLEMQLREEGKTLDERTIAEAQVAHKAYQSSRSEMWRAYYELEQQYRAALPTILMPQQMEQVKPPTKTFPDP